MVPTASPESSAASSKRKKWWHVGDVQNPLSYRVLPVQSSPWRQRIILASTFVAMFYLAYRGLFTLNLTTGYAAFASLFLYFGEIFGIVSIVLFYLQVWQPSEPPEQPVLEGRTVDVFIPTYNEDPHILRATVEACNRLDYPHQTYLCDDGKRPEVEELAKAMGINYIIRPDNKHAKAGNLNHAFSKTNGEFVVILDADHVPEPHFISRLIGYFADDKLGYVQTPHAFYNFDSFQTRYNHKRRFYWEEGLLFYQVIQPGRNLFHIATFAGAAAMFRRTALEEVGYIATETITEDLHTGLRLNAKGWRSLGISERMIVGQAAPDITTFHSQRLRWGEGNLSIMAYDNPLTMKGLSLVQRLCYLGSMIHWAGGVFKIGIYLTPVLMLFTGVPPVNEFTWTLVGIMAVYLLLCMLGVKVASNGYASLSTFEVYSMANFWTQIRGTTRAIFWRRFQKFIVTTKRGRQSKRIWPFVRPQVYLAGISVLALVWGWSRVILGVSDDIFKPMMPSVWIVFHLFLIGVVVQRALWPEDKRFSYRHLVHLPVTYAVVEDNEVLTRGLGMTGDLNETGMCLVAYEPIPRNQPMRIKLRGGIEVIECGGQVRWESDYQAPDGTKGYLYGLQFESLTAEQVDTLNRICFHYAVPRLFDLYERRRRTSFWHRLMQTSFARHAKRMEARAKR